MHKGASWLQWEEKYKRRDFAALDQVWHGQHEEIQFYQFSGTSPARRSPFYDNSIDGIMQELRTFQNTVFHEKK